MQPVGGVLTMHELQQLRPVGLCPTSRNWMPWAWWHYRLPRSGISPPTIKLKHCSHCSFDRSSKRHRVAYTSSPEAYKFLQFSAGKKSLGHLGLHRATKFIIDTRYPHEVCWEDPVQEYLARDWNNSGNPSVASVSRGAWSVKLTLVTSHHFEKGVAINQEQNMINCET